MFVLIVEDQPLHAKLFAELLRAEGHFTVIALSGREGLAMMAKTRPDLVVIDILLPDVDGRQLITQMRRTPVSAMIPILAVSAVPDRDMERSCVSAGANKFLCKPLRAQEFTLAVANLA